MHFVCGTNKCVLYLKLNFLNINYYAEFWIYPAIDTLQKPLKHRFSLTLLTRIIGIDAIHQHTLHK